MYAAKHYVRINRTVLTAGEILPDGLPEEKIAWLLSAGAIYEIPGTGKTETDCHGADAPRNDREKRPGEEQAAEGVGIYKEEPEAGRLGEEPEEIDEEAEPEEIDVMAGIVPQKEKETAEAASKSGKRGGRRSK